MPLKMTKEEQRRGSGTTHRFSKETRKGVVRYQGDCVPTRQEGKMNLPERVCNNLRGVREPSQHKAANEERVVNVQEVVDAAGGYHLGNSIARKDRGKVTRLEGVINIHRLDLHTSKCVSLGPPKTSIVCGQHRRHYRGRRSFLVKRDELHLAGKASEDFPSPALDPKHRTGHP
jgi:hypothetical protein